MVQTVKMIAVVRNERSAATQGLFRALVDRWRSSARIVGVIEETQVLADRTCSAGQLRSIADGSCHPIFQDLGPGSEACHLEGAGALSASEAVRRDIAAGCDLVVLSKFGKLEAGREGLVTAFAAAFEAGVPVLTSVSPAFHDAWTRFASPLFTMLPAEQEAIDGWWRAVRQDAGGPATGAQEHGGARPGPGSVSARAPERSP